MYQWRQSPRWSITRWALVALLLACNALGQSIGWEPAASDFICGSDINGDGQWTTAGEARLCDQGSTYSATKAFNSGTGYVSDPLGLSCPIGQTSCIQASESFCPFDGSRCIAGTTSCSQSQSCELRQSDEGDRYRCAITGALSDSQDDCNANCQQTQSCEVQKTFNCPLGDELSCINLDASNTTDNFVCSTHSCGTYAENSEENTTDSRIFIDDGDYDEEGQCLGSVMIFGGRAMDCRLPGVSSAYQNCCEKDDGEVYHDSMGSIVDTYSYMQGITTAYEAAAVAYNAYSAGATATEAATAASDFMATSFDPTTMAVTVVISLIMNYLEKACPPEDIETAIMDASGFCVHLGDKCTKKWFGNCVQTVEVKCCFSSKLARLIHEQGRPQLGMSFGTAEAPNCQGFDAEAFQSLDFSKIDLSSYYDELRYKNQTDIEDGFNHKISNKVGQ